MHGAERRGTKLAADSLLHTPMGYMLPVGVPLDTALRTPDEIGVTQMASYEPGTVLTCGHDGCGCRVRIEVECHCNEAGEPYRCTCGEELVAVGK
jgi:hypothetical protein